MSGAIAITVSQGSVLPALTLSQGSVLELAVTQDLSLPSIIIQQGTSISPAPTLATNPLGSNPHASWTFQSGGWVQYAPAESLVAWGVDDGSAIGLEDHGGILVMED